MMRRSAACKSHSMLPPSAGELQSYNCFGSDHSTTPRSTAPLQAQYQLMQSCCAPGPGGKQSHVACTGPAVSRVTVRLPAIRSGCWCGAWTAESARSPQWSTPASALPEWPPPATQSAAAQLRHRRPGGLRASSGAARWAPACVPPRSGQPAQHATPSGCCHGTTQGSPLSHAYTDLSGK